MAKIDSSGEGERWRGLWSDGDRCAEEKWAETCARSWLFDFGELVRGVLSVGIFAAEPAIHQDNLALCDVVAKPEPSGTKPVLAFTWLNPLQLLDRVGAALVVRVSSENQDCVFEPFQKSGCLGESFFTRRSNAQW